MTRRCRNQTCKRLFAPKRPWQTYCSSVCRKSNGNRRQYRDNRAKIDARHMRYYRTHRDELVMKQQDRDALQKDACACGGRKRGESLMCKSCFNEGNARGYRHRASRRLAAIYRMPTRAAP